MKTAPARGPGPPFRWPSVSGPANATALSLNSAPVIQSARPRERFQLGAYRAVLLGDIEPAGFVEYLHILAVYDQDDRPCFFVAAEVNSMASLLGGRTFSASSTVKGIPISATPTIGPTRKNSPPKPSGSPARSLYRPSREML